MEKEIDKLLKTILIEDDPMNEEPTLITIYDHDGNIIEVIANENK